MKLFIDGDGCPVVDLAVRTAGEFGTEVVLFCDTAHELSREGMETIVVSTGADSVDFALVNALRPGDIVVTQDYGLAAMCLARRARALNQNGLIYDEQNMDSLLLARHTARKIRRAGGRLKGPSKRTREQDAAFECSLRRILSGRR